MAEAWSTEELRPGVVKSSDKIGMELIDDDLHVRATVETQDPTTLSTVLEELAKPYPSRYIKDDGRGNSYVPHHIVNQRLIHIFKRPPKVELLREIYDGETLTGVVMRLTVPGFDPVEEAGEADNPQSKTNGARLKDACSDAIKRCAMRLGNGLHLWAQDDYFLYGKLQEKP